MHPTFSTFIGSPPQDGADPGTLGHFATWIGSPPSRWRGSWNTWATLLPGWAGRPQDGGGPGIRGPPGWPE